MARVLIVDDAVFMRTMIKNMLAAGGHEVAGEASDGAQALEKYKELSPDVVTMDITMPGTDGLQGLKMIMAYDPGAKVIMCSAMGQQAMVVEAVQSGAKDFIVKPFQQDKVLGALAKVAGA